MKRQRVDAITIVGLGMLLLPLLTMWHEIGGHAAACAMQGGHVATIGAFYVHCDGLTRRGDVVVACAGVAMNSLLALLAFASWRRAKGDLGRTVLWLVWVGQAFVAAGYLCFSGATAAGDLGLGAHGAIGPVPNALSWRLLELTVGVGTYVVIVRRAIEGLGDMLGDDPSTQPTRRRISHLYYATCGITAVLVGLLNPLGLYVTLMSAVASTFGGLAGFIRVGQSLTLGNAESPFSIDRNWPVFIAGVIVLTGYAVILGPSMHFS